MKLQIIEQMPHFITANYQMMLDASDDRARVSSGLATFERCLRLLTIIVITQYLIRDQDEIVEPSLNKLLSNRFPLGDLQSWLDVFLTTLKTYEGYPDQFFVPEIYHFYWDTSNPEKHTPQPEVEQLLVRLVALNNDWQGGENLPTSLRHWSSLAQEIYTLVEELLVRMSFFAEYELLFFTSSSENVYQAELHKGPTIRKIQFEFEGMRLEPNLYYLSKDRCDFLKLNPLLTAWQTEQEETAIFIRLTQYYQLRYLLSLTAGLTTDKTHLEEFLSLMQTIEECKQRPEQEKLTWLQLLAIAEEITSKRTATISGKFDKETYLQRQEALALFQEFLASESSCFVLTGKSGAGKSNFVLSLQDEYKGNSDICMLTIDASTIDTDKGLNKFISEDFELHCGLGTNDLWAEIENLPGMTTRKVILVLDAINENMRSQVLLQQVNDLLLMQRKWLKVLISSRPEAWQRMCHGQHLAESFFFQPLINVVKRDNEHPYLSAVNLESFSWEESQAAYERYRSRYQIATLYASLSPEVRSLVREPLQLWMIADIHQGRNISEELHERELVELYINALLTTRRLFDEDIYFLQHELIPLMSPEEGHYTNVITAAVLELAGGNLLDRVFSEGYYSSGKRVSESFQRLADAQIVVKRLQGITSEVLFKYERFYDHFLGQFLFEQYIKPASEPTEICRKLIDAIETQPFLWGAVEYALYLTVEKKFDTLLSLAFTDSLNISYLIVAVLTDYAKSNSQEARQLLNQLVALSVSRKSGIPLNQRLQATEIALRMAATLDDIDTFIQVLLCKESMTRDVGVKHAYYLGKRKPQHALEILKLVSEEITKPALTLNVPALQSTFRLAPLLVLDCYQGGELASPIVNDLTTVFRDALNRISDKVLFRIFRPIIRSWIAHVFTKILIEVVTKPGENKKAPSIHSILEYRRFYKQSKELRDRARAALVYLDRSYGSLNEVVDLIAQFHQVGDRVSETIADYIVDAYGIHSPWEAEQILYHVVEEVKDPSNNVYLFATARWYTIMDRYPGISTDALKTMKIFVSRWLGSNQYGYGTVHRYDQTYQYHPLNSYGALWTRVYQGISVDLFETYIAQAVATNDHQLLLHIIDTFGDLRHPLHDYHATLRILAPYVNVEKTNPIRDHLVKSLGSLHGLYPQPVEHFLIESEAPRELVTDIQSYSYQKPTNELYMRFSQLLSDLLAYAPVEFVREIIRVVDESLVAHSFDQTALILVNGLLNMAVEQ